MASRGSFFSSAMACWRVDFNWSISEGMVGSSVQRRVQAQQPDGRVRVEIERHIEQAGDKTLHAQGGAGAPLDESLHRLVLILEALALRTCTLMTPRTISICTRILKSNVWGSAMAEISVTWPTWTPRKTTGAPTFRPSTELSKNRT